MLPSKLEEYFGTDLYYSNRVNSLCLDPLPIIMFTNDVFLTKTTLCLLKYDEEKARTCCMISIYGHAKVDGFPTLGMLGGHFTVPNNNKSTPVQNTEIDINVYTIQGRRWKTRIEHVERRHIECIHNRIQS